MTLAELRAQRDKLTREIKEREDELYKLSMENLSRDLKRTVDRTDTLYELAQEAAQLGLVLTTTKSI